MNPSQTLLLLGVGQLGRLYAGGALRSGACVVPILRDTDVAPVLCAYPEGTPVLCAVGESDLDDAVARFPIDRRADLVFVQNELLPDDLERLGARGATLAVVWTLQKPGMPTLVARATGVGGRHAAAVLAWHRALELPCTLYPPELLAIEAAAKYAFIVAINALGVLAPHTVGEWRRRDPARVDALVREATAIAVARIDAPTAFDETLSRVWDGATGFEALPTRGRSSAARVVRALGHAARLSLSTPTLTEVGGACTP